MLVVEVMLCNVLCVGQEQENLRYVLVEDIKICNVLCVGEEQED